MSDLTRWPKRNKQKLRRKVQGVTLPWEWLHKWGSALLWLKTSGYAENESHAIIKAVIETAEREGMNDE